MDAERREPWPREKYVQLPGDGRLRLEELIINFLIDIRYYCSEHDIDFGDCERIAEMQHVKQLRSQLEAKKCRDPVS